MEKVAGNTRSCQKVAEKLVGSPRSLGGGGGGGGKGSQTRRIMENAQVTNLF